jgi:hypothetical protein
MIPANEGKYAPTTIHQLGSQNPHDAHVHRVPSEELVNQSRNKDLPDGVANTITPIAMATTYRSAYASMKGGGPTPCSSNIEYIPKLTTGIAIHQLSSFNVPMHRLQRDQGTG